jgi:hypothetical protein
LAAGIVYRTNVQLGGEVLAPPAGAASPAQWGDPQTIRERLGDAVTEITFDRQRIYKTGLSPKHVATQFEDSAAPVIKVVQALKNDPVRLAECRAALEQLVATYFEDNQVRQDYLMTRAIKRR